MDNSSPVLPFSYHVFAWPFQIHGETTKSYIRNLLRKHSPEFWRELKSTAFSVKGTTRDRESVERYMLWQYFSNSARNIFPEINPVSGGYSNRALSSAACRILQLKLDEQDESEYVIEKIRDSGKEVFTLRITKIELHIYDFGCGVLFFYTENRNYARIRDIKKIADWGRRITMPFLPDKVGGYTITADYLRISLPGYRFTSTLDLRNIERTYPKTSNNGLTLLEDFVKTDCSRVIPFTDDRLFEIILIRNVELSRQVSRWWDCASQNEDIQKMMYSLIYIDPDDPSCQNAQMRTELLRESTNPRWTDYGTIHAATGFSMFCLTSDSPQAEAPVIRPFLAEYPYLVSLVLAQRTGLTRYSEKAGTLASSGFIWNWRGKLAQTQKQFNMFRNQIMIPEPTHQDQGMELYELLQKQMRIHQREELLDNQLEDLFDIADVKFQTWLAIILAVLALVISPILSGFIAPIMEKIGSQVFGLPWP